MKYNIDRNRVHGSIRVATLTTLSYLTILGVLHRERQIMPIEKSFKSKNCIICNTIYIPTGNNQKVCKKCKSFYIIRWNKEHREINEKHYHEYDRGRRELGNTWDKKHIEKAKEYFRQYRKKAFEEGKTWNQQHPEMARERSRQYYWANKEKQSIKNKERRIERRNIVLNHYGNKCICCGEIEPKFLTIDHIDSDGYKYRPIKGGLSYSWIIKNNFPTNLQILCWNCNMSKGCYGECPHVTKRKVEGNYVEKIRQPLLPLK
jgi:hypothetical protein